ncbi:helix-turn-helix transcriptional regulator [Kitasatospora sp. NPDC005751]|uniref:helix-turn-helix domain-containing protein n=1 Tax=Kitasatospora sp. NPDC005751 TaxID=3157064 RepID=UPI0034100587
MDIPAILRAARAVKRATLAEVGAHAGYSPSAMSRILRGQMAVTDNALLRIAEFLDVPPVHLGLRLDSPARHAPATVPGEPAAIRVTTGHQCSEDEVRRRIFLAAGAAGVGAAVISAGQADAETVATNPRIDSLEEALFTPGAAVPLPDLTATLTTARADFRAARYSRLRRTLPTLISGAEAARDASTGLAREQACAAVARSYVLATELAVKESSDYAWATADRALTAARASGSPIAVGEAARVLAITMRRSGRINSAVQLLTSTANQLDSQAGREEDVLAVRTTLLLTGAYTAATGGDSHTANDLVAEAERTVGLIPAGRPGELFTVEATAEQVMLYRIGIATALNDPDAGVPHARALDPARLPTRERRARFHTDTARLWTALGDNRRTYEALQAMERVAPEELRRPSIRAVTVGLVHSPARLPGLRAFAVRTGALEG